MKQKANLIFVTAVIIGAVLRVGYLSKYPTGFSADEASYGYNAYSLLKTGRDEWGAPWYQIIYANLRSFGDARFPLYAFLTVPSIKIFGLTEFAVRLPNAILGTLAIAAIYLLTSKLFPQSRGLAALLIAISPWHISLSRGAFETNTLTLLIPLGIYLLLSNRFFLGAAILALNTYSYIAARALTLPMIIITLWLAKTSKQNWQKVIVLFLIIAGPGLWFMARSGNTRVADVGIFNPTDRWQEVATRRFQARNIGLPDAVARMFNNKLVYLTSNFTKNYLSYFSPQFLFTSGAGEATYGMIPGRGVLYYLEIPFLLAFLISFIKTPSSNKLLLILLLLISPFPAALSKGGGFAANRTASMIPFLIIMSAVGIKYVFSSFPKTLKLLTVSVFVIYFCLFVFFVEDYLYHAPLVNGPSMAYGWKQLIPRLVPIADRFSDVRFSRALSEPQIFLAFYTKFSPVEYQKYSQSWKDFDRQGLTFLDQLDGYYLGKYRFGDIHPTDSVTHPILFIAPPSQFPLDFPEYFHIDYPNGQTAIKVAEKLP